MFRRSQRGEFIVGGDENAGVFVQEGDTGRAVLRRVQELRPARLEVAGSGPCFRFERQESAFSCHLASERETFSEATLRELPHQLSSLMTALDRDPERDIDRLPLLGDAQQRALILELRGSRGPRSSGELPAIIRTIETQARRQPEALAIISEAGAISYGELERRANEVAHWLHRLGIRDGMPVAVYMDTCIEFVVAMLGVFKAGGAHVPLDPTYPASRIETILHDIRPKATLTHRARVESLRDQRDQDVGRVLVLDATEARAELAELAGTPLRRELDPDQTAYIIYTSGTTGKPKGVMLSHANLAHYIDVASREYGYCERDTIPAMARHSFSISFFELLSPLASGARLRLLGPDVVLDLDRMVQILQETTCLHASPSWWRKMIAHIDDNAIAPASFSTLRHVSSGGDMVPPDVLESLKRIFEHAEVFVIYGCSEVACMACTYPVPRDRKIVSTRVGRAFPNVSLRVLDPARNLVPPGFVGEVYFGGAGLASGYLHAPELSAEKFITLDGERLYHTGDLGRVDDEGNLQLLGRSDFQIKLRGFRIEPAEVEVSLRAMPGIADAIVVAPLLDGGENKLVAYVVADGKEPPSSREIRLLLRDELPDYMVPAHYLVVDALPLNHNGKVDRKALPTPTPAQLASATGGHAPRTDDERRLLALWREVMGIETIGIHDDFFDLGGDSLVGVELMTRIDRELGVAMPVSALLEHPSVAELAPRLDPRHQVKTEDSSIVCLRPGTARPAIFFIHDGEGETIVYRNLSRSLAPGSPVYGVHPKRSGLHPILHTRISEMVEYYADEIRKTCAGPYVVGGLCVGGFLAFEVARRLQALGESVSLVVLLDAAHVQVSKKSRSSTRLASLSQSLREISTDNVADSLVQGVSMVAKKAHGMATYELRARLQQRKTTRDIRAFRDYLDQGLPIPASLHQLGVDPILRFAELEFQDPGVYEGEVVLIRATRPDSALEGIDIDDTPYREVVGDPLMGWENRSTAFHIEDLDAGHSSMLQESMAPLVAKHLDGYLGPSTHPRVQGSISRFAEGCSLLVVIVSYRSAKLVVDSLGALEAERPAHRDLRVVVVDNTCGVDGATVSAAIAERGWSAWAMVEVAPKNGGFAYGNNLGIRGALAASDPPAHIWLLNPDTRVCPASSRALVDFLDAEAQAGIVGSCLVDPDGSEWGKAFRFPSLLGELEGAAHLWPITRLLEGHVVARKMGEAAEQVDWISGASMMVRREVFEEVGLFDEDYFLYYEETDFCLNARHSGWRVWYVPESRVMHIAGESTGVTSRSGPPMRVPEYVFDSRRRYFVKNHGLGYAAIADLAKVGALAAYRIRQKFQEQVDLDPPSLLWDSIRGSVFMKGPRNVQRRRHG